MTISARGLPWKYNPSWNLVRQTIVISKNDERDFEKLTSMDYHKRDVESLFGSPPLKCDRAFLTKVFIDFRRVDQTASPKRDVHANCLDRPFI